MFAVYFGNVAVARTHIHIAVIGDRITDRLIVIVANQTVKVGARLTISEDDRSVRAHVVVVSGESAASEQSRIVR